jgi:hypothetical protein
MTAFSGKTITTISCGVAHSVYKKKKKFTKFKLNFFKKCVITSDAEAYCWGPNV